jgi:hypothetical protein
MSSCGFTSKVGLLLQIGLLLLTMTQSAMSQALQQFLNESPPADDAPCGAKPERWMEIMSANDIRSALLRVRFHWSGGLAETRLQAVRYFRSYPETSYSEMTDHRVLDNLKATGLEEQLYAYAVKHLPKVLAPRVRDAGLSTADGEIIYPLYDNPCAPLILFPPSLIDPDQTDLMKAAESQDMSKVNNLLKSGSTLESKDQHQRTALHYASMTFGNRDVIAALISAGANVNARDGSGYTPMMNSAELGDFDALSLLLMLHADPNLKDNTGSTALMKAADAGPGGLRALSLLASAGACLNDQNRSGQTALMIAASHGNVDGVRKLVDLGADIEIRDNEGKTALDHARDRLGGTNASHQAVASILQRFPGKSGIDGSDPSRPPSLP